MSTDPASRPSARVLGPPDAEALPQTWEWHPVASGGGVLGARVLLAKLQGVFLEVDHAGGADRPTVIADDDGRAPMEVKFVGPPLID